jgi:MFS family permease
MDAAAKGILHVSTAFLGPALIQLASTSAEERFCQDQYTVDDDDNTCSPIEDDLRVFGLRPSSILTVSSVTATAVAAIALPFIGALIDRSSHRKTVGAATAFALVFFNAIQVMLSQQNWPLFWLSKTVADFTFIVHTSILLAFMKDLTTDSGTLATYSSKFSILHFTCTAGFTLLVVIFAHWTHKPNKHLLGTFVSAVIDSSSGILDLFGHRPNESNRGFVVYSLALHTILPTYEK